MKALFIFTILTCFSLLVRAQTDQRALDFIRSHVMQEKPILYFKKLDKITIGEIKRALDRDTIYNDLLLRPNVGKPLLRIVFTPDEKAFINAEIDRFRFFKWGNDIFPNGKAIGLKARNRYAENVDGWTHYPDKYGRKIYSFSKPIFLRNNTLCIFYSGYLCGRLCGTWTLKIYEMQDGNWQDKYFVTKTNS